MIPRHAQPTADHLAAAYARIATGPRWPASLDEALRHPVYRIAVSAVARRLACQVADASPPPAAAPRPRAARAVGLPFDPKRAAAHDRDDD